MKERKKKKKKSEEDGERNQKGSLRVVKCDTFLRRERTGGMEISCESCHELEAE